MGLRLSSHASRSPPASSSLSAATSPPASSSFPAPPAPSDSPPPLPSSLPSSLPTAYNGSSSFGGPLDDSMQLLSQDVEWLDSSEITLQEDEDVRLAKQATMSLADWLARPDASDALSHSIVEVSDPQIIRKYFGRKAVEFSVTTSASMVKRRYKDFSALRDGLETRYPGAIIPPLPPVPTHGKNTPKNINKRRLALQYFLRGVLAHPYLSSDDLVAEFLTSTLKFDRKQALRARGKIEKWSESSKQWALALTETSPEPIQALTDPVTTLQVASQELESIHKALTQLNVALKSHAAKTLVFSKSLQDVAAAFHSGANAEYALTQLKSPVASDVLETGQRSFSQQSVLVQTNPDELFQSLGSFLRYERWFVETYLRAVRRCRSSISKHQRALGAYKQARDESLSLSTAVATAAASAAIPTTPTTDEKQRARLQRLRQAAVQAQRDARRDIRGVLCLELDRFRQERGPRMRTAFALMSQSMFDEAVAVASMWRALAASPSKAGGDGANGAGGAGGHVEEEDFESHAARMLGRRRPSQLEVLYPFTKEHKDELQVDRGTMLHGVPDENPDWMVAKDPATGAVGLVPRSYVKVLDDDQALLKEYEYNDCSKGDEDEGGQDDFEDEPPPPSTPGNPFAPPPPPPPPLLPDNPFAPKPPTKKLDDGDNSGDLAINISGKRPPPFSSSSPSSRKKSPATDL